MKSIDEADAQARLNDILNEAQRQPIVIRQQDRDIAVVLSAAAYERRRLDTVRAVVELRNDIAREAPEAGLTEEGFARLLGGD